MIKIIKTIVKTIKHPSPREGLGGLLLAVLLVMTSCAVDKNYKRGEKYLALGEFYDAGNEFRKAYAKTSPREKTRRGQIALKMAYCYRRGNQSQKAIAAYANAIRYKTATAEDHFYYAQQLMKNGNYKLAAQEYQLVLDSMPGNKLAKVGLQSAQAAPQLKADGSNYTVKKMDVFNSRRAEYSPALTGDQFDQIYFTSTRNEAQGDEYSGITGTKAGDIFFSQKDDKGKWTKPEDVSGGLNTDYDEGAGQFSPDGKDMYLTQCTVDPDYPRMARVMKSSRADASWGKATEVKILNDTLTLLAHPAVTPDGLYLYFVSDMPGGKGGLDIWRADLTSVGVGSIQNLGSPVNTEGDEEFPTFRPNGDLYFSSNGHEDNLGGLDIYCAKVGNDHHYHISHPGFPLNSSGDDFGMTFEGPYNRGFFSSNRGDGRGWDHIYSFENPEVVQAVKGWVYEQDGYELPAAEVYIVGSDGTNKKVSVRSDGSFTYTIQPNIDYLFLATCKGYLNHKEELRVQPVRQSEEYTLQFALPNIGVPVVVDNVFYDFDKATLKPESYPALDKLVNMLKDNPNITIELAAHCDYRGAAEYNKRLSQKRAESVVNYLVEHGIDTLRLTPVGYGEDQPKTIRKKLAEKATWLHEGDVLTEDFITKFDTNKQEVCNQLNRRTEFRVLRTTYGLFDKNGQLKQPVPSKHQDEDIGDEEDSFEIE